MAGVLEGVLFKCWPCSIVWSCSWSYGCGNSLKYIFMKKRNALWMNVWNLTPVHCFLTGDNWFKFYVLAFPGSFANIYFGLAPWSAMKLNNSDLIGSQISCPHWYQDHMYSLATAGSVAEGNWFSPECINTRHSLKTKFVFLIVN